MSRYSVIALVLFAAVIGLTGSRAKATDGVVLSGNSLVYTGQPWIMTWVTTFTSPKYHFYRTKVYHWLVGQSIDWSDFQQIDYGPPEDGSPCTKFMGYVFYDVADYYWRVVSYGAVYPLGSWSHVSNDITLAVR